MRKLTTNEFIEKSNEIHNNRYDYSNTIYTGCKNDVEIICSIHGKFTQNAQSHLNGHECTKCSGHYIYSKIEFIEKANIVHNKYDYSLTNYINSRNKIKIICPIHGEFIIRANNHLLGIGCSKCSGKNKNISEIIDDFNKIYDYKYDYSLVNNYKDKHSIIKIICPIHGEFEKIAYAHNNGHGCPKCGINTLSTSKFIELSKLNHNNKYDYSLVKYNGVMNTVKIICPIHGMFEQISRFHLNGSDCPNCSESKGEKEIRNYLDNNNILYIRNKRFKNCRHKNTLPFDFYLPDNNICIEFDGIQHFEIIDYWLGSDGLKDRIIRDKIKTDYCFNNKITLIRIKYNENIVEKLSILL